MTTEEILLKLRDLYRHEMVLEKQLEKIKQDANKLTEQLKNIYK